MGCCTATSGPGAIHLLNGLYDAKLDHQSVVAVVGQQKRLSLGSHYRQEVHLDRLFAADHPGRREYWVGGSTVATLLGQKVAAGLLDRYLARTAYDSQQTADPPDRSRPANLWKPADGTHGADHGTHGADHGTHGVFDTRRAPAALSYGCRVTACRSRRSSRARPEQSARRSPQARAAPLTRTGSKHP